MLPLEPHLLIDLGSDYTGWKDITSDVMLDNPIRWKQGICSNDVRDRVAQTGTMMFELDNSSDNSAKLAGYYSPGHSDALTGFDIGCRLRWQYDTQPCQDTSFIIASDTPTSDLFDTDTQLTYTGTVAKTDNSFDDGLYYPAFTSDNYAEHDTDESTIIEGLNLNGHTIAFWVCLSSDNAAYEMPEVFLQISTSDEACKMTEKVFTTATATDATYYPSVTRTYSDGVGDWSQTLIFSDASLSTDWSHIALTFSDSDSLITMYINGVPMNAAFSSDVITATTDTYKNFYIKLGNNLGSMGHFAIWNKVLSSDEIYDHYYAAEFSYDATIATAHQAPLIYYVMGAKESSSAATYLEQNRGIRYTWAQLEAGYKPCMGYYQFDGRISAIESAPGKFGERVTKIESVDWIDDASNVVIGSVPALAGYTADQILALMIMQTDVIPPTNDLDTGATTLNYALSASSQADTLYSEMKRIAVSEPGYIYIRNGAGSDGELGGVLTFENKAARFEKTSTDADISDDPTSDAAHSLSNERNIDKLINACEVTVHPVEVDAIAVPIYTMSSDLVPTIPAFGELVMNVKYTDTDEAYEMVGAYEVVQPERNTDYTINSRADGLGNDKTNDVRCTIAATDSDNLIGYWIMGEQSGFVLSNYVRPSGVAISHGGSYTGDGGINPGQGTVRIGGGSGIINVRKALWK